MLQGSWSGTERRAGVAGADRTEWRACGISPPPPAQRNRQGQRRIAAAVPHASRGDAMMEYKGYFAGVTFDAENDIFHGEVVGIRDVITFQGSSVTNFARPCASRWTTTWSFAASGASRQTKPLPAVLCSASRPNCIGASASWRPRPGRASTPGSRHAWPARWSKPGWQPRA